MDELLRDDAPEQIAQDDAQQGLVVDTGEVLPEPQEFIKGEVEEAEVLEKDTSEDWEHKYRVLKGKYDKEVPRLQKELRILKDEKERLLQRLSLLESVVAQVMNSQKSSAPREEEDEDEDVKRIASDYPELYRAVQKLIEKKLVKEVQPKLEEIKTSATQSSFYSRLSMLVPNWQEINTDPEFLEWLSTPSEEVPSKTKHQLMLMAFNEGDAEGVASFFKRYLQQKKEVNEMKATPQAEKSVAPPHRKVAQSPKEVTKKIFKESEIKQFYTDVALGKIPPDKKEALERQILEAIMENRILYGK